MNIFKKLFGRKNIYFEITVDVIKYPEGWSKEIQDLVSKLKVKEKAMLLKLCGILQNHLEKHFNYWRINNFTRDRLKNNHSLLFKSYFELLMIDWKLITHSFKKRNIRDEVGQALWWVIHYSLDSYSNILYSKKNFRNYNDAFNSRSMLYSKILSDYFSDDNNKRSIAMQNMFTLLILNPLTIDISNLQNESIGNSIIGNTLDFENWDNNVAQSSAFNSYLAKEMESISKEINSALEL